MEESNDSSNQDNCTKNIGFKLGGLMKGKRTNFKSGL